MDIYNGWFDLKPGIRDLDFHAALERYMTHLQERQLIAGWRLMRRKLGLGPDHLAEFHLMIEVEGLAQLDLAFGHVASRAEPVEEVHHGVNSMVTNVRFALYRDFPDAVRQSGEERF